MGKQRALTTTSLIGEIFQVGLYKATQGRVTRQVTCGVLWVTFAIAAYRAYTLLYNHEALQYGVPIALLLIGFWGSYRLVNYPQFADFLIAVEAEMNKVSWPSRNELVRSSMVVIFVIFALAIVLFGYDLLWKFLFRDVLRILG
jgi:preprotein translocase subunit SecE